MNVGYLLGIDFNIPLWLLLLLTAFVLYYIYMTWNNGIFKELGIPGPRPVPFLGNLLLMFKEGIVAHDNRYIKQYGDLVGTFQGRMPILLCRDLDMVKQILVKQFNYFVDREIIEFQEPVLANMLSSVHGDRWRFMRNTMTPTFSGGKLKKMMKHMIVTTDQLLANLDSVATTGETFNFEEYSKSYAMDIIAGTAFGLQVDSQKDKDSQFVKMAQKGFDFQFTSPVMIVFFFFPFLTPYVHKVGINMMPKDVTAFFTKVTEQIVEDRQKNPKNVQDFIQLVMNAHKEDDKSKESSKQDASDEPKKSLTRTEIMANSVLFFLAGYETTASALAYIAHLLAVNPECQDKLYQQIEEVLEGQEPTYDLLHKLPYLDQTLEETLRLYPPAPRIQRVANETVTINGVRIPKGMEVDVPVESLHRDPKLWPDPEKFEPERFSPENKASRDPYCYMPFGLGPRNCVGMRLAQLEIKVAIVKLLQKYRFKQAPETQIPLMKSDMRAFSTKGVFLQAEKRTHTEE